METCASSEAETVVASHCGYPTRYAVAQFATLTFVSTLRSGRAVVAQNEQHEIFDVVIERKEINNVENVVCGCNFETGSIIKPLKTPKSSNERGATRLEYGVMVALILVESVAALRPWEPKLILVSMMLKTSLLNRAY